MASKKLVDCLLEESTKTTTENGAMALASTRNKMLDLFASIGALRERSYDDITYLFSKAYGEDKLLATKCLFYARDVREGLGERRTFRIILNDLAKYHPEAVKKNISLIPEYGRWDDLYSLFDTQLQDDAIALIKNQLDKDEENMKNNKPISLLAKWLKSETRSKPTKELARKTYTLLGLSAKDYRKKLSALRHYIDVTEVKMSNNSWALIDYAKVPSLCMIRHKNAWVTHDEIRYCDYLNDVKAGTAKINTGTLYPYDIIRPYINNLYGEKILVNEQDQLIWDNLPNYVTKSEDILICPDFSGSMTWNGGQPIKVSLSLALYFAERNKGVFHNTFMSFSSEPMLFSFNDEQDLNEKFATIRYWANKRDGIIGYSTDIEKVFDCLLNTAIANKLSNNDLPKAIIMISDMEFDTAADNTDLTYFNILKKKFYDYGYDLPKLIFWNVNARNEVFHATNDDPVLFASGSSANVFKQILDSLNSTPEEMMLKVLNSERYSAIKVED